MSYAFVKPTLPDVDEVAIKRRINEAMNAIDTPEKAAELYCDTRAHVSYRRMLLETDMLFETNLMRAIEARFRKQMEAEQKQIVRSKAFKIALAPSKPFDEAATYVKIERAA